jgi:hypothetical protein
MGGKETTARFRYAQRCSLIGLKLLNPQPQMSVIR